MANSAVSFDLRLPAEAGDRESGNFVGGTLRRSREVSILCLAKCDPSARYVLVPGLPTRNAVEPRLAVANVEPQTFPSSVTQHVELRAPE
jgi:hypothetical protein